MKRLVQLLDWLCYLAKKDATFADSGGSITARSSMKDVYELLEGVSQVLWRTFVLGYAMLLIWFLGATLPGDFICRLQSGIFGLTAHECMLINYGGIACAKLLLMLFFLFPWIAIRWWLHKQKKAAS